MPLDRQDTLRRLLAAPIAHRGLHAGGDRSRVAGPIENSIGAAEAAIAAGYGIECDIQPSRDGEAMVFHDTRLERLTRGAGLVAEFDAEDLDALAMGDGSDRIPTLAAFLAAIAGRVPLVIEIKSAGDGDMRLADRALALLAGYDGPVALESFDQAIVAHCREAGAPCPLGLVGPPDDGGAIVPDGCDFLSWSIDAVAALAAKYPHVPLTTWTVRTRAQQALAASAKAQIVFEGFRPELP